MSSRYRLYVDESGDHVFHEEQTLSQPAHRYLALLGCLFLQKDYLLFADALEAFKRDVLDHDPDEPVILHRSDIVNKKGPFWILREAARQSAFDQALRRLLLDAQFRMIVIVIDKLRLKSQYPTPWHPYHIALTFLLQRYCGLLNHMNAVGDVLAESRGRREDALLSDAYSHNYTRGDMHHKATWYQRALTSSNLKLQRKKANVAGLQLADLLAYPMKQAVLVENGAIEALSGGFGAQLAEDMRPKYNRQLYTGHVEGYGAVLFPK